MSRRARKRPRPGVWTRKDRAWPRVGEHFERSGQSRFAMVRNGVVLPLIPVLYGLFPLITGVVDQRTRGARLHMEGIDARAFGLAAIALGAALHVHFYWGAHPRLSEHSTPALLAAAAVFLGAIALIVVF